MAVIEHVIVLALENRSFDHMLGYLDHPNPQLFDGLGNGGPYTNPGWNGGDAVKTEAAATRVLPVDPDHSHTAVMEQLSVGADGRPTNQGFVTSYERKGRGLAEPRFDGLLGPLINWWIGRKKPAPPVEGRGPLIMQCQPPAHVPVLSELARSFAVCTRWFCSVPGETWPNRNFMHAATSSGETDIQVRPFHDRTIFELLEEHGKSWHVYQNGTPQVWAFPRLWDSPERHANWHPFAEFARHVREGKLPHYAFIEPNHNIQLTAVGPEPTGGSDSQHPGNNKSSDDDFVRAEALIATIYEALRSRPEVFEKSVFLITYDEHGGFYDHVRPPGNVPHPGDRPGRLARVLRFLWHKRSRAFDFTMLGPRVPTVVVSPYVHPGTVDTQERDHASIPATLRHLFAPDAPPLTRRDGWAARFDTVLTLDVPRRADLPDLSARTAAPEIADSTPRPEEVPDHAADFVRQAKLVRRRLRRVREPEIRRAPDVYQAFIEAASRHREELRR